MNQSQIICLGEALVDRLGPLGGDPSVDLPVNDCLGGAPANVACGLAKLGVNVAFIGCLGDDSIGRQFHDLFVSCGVNITGLQVNQKLPSRIVLVIRDHYGERTFGGFVNSKSELFADHGLDLDHLKKQWPIFAKHANVLLLGTILLSTEDSRRVVQWSIDQSLKQGCKIAMDLNWRPTFWDKTFLPDSPPTEKICSLIQPFLEKVEFLKLSKEEALWFFHCDDPCLISNGLSSRPSVIITDGCNPIRWKLGDFSGVTEACSPYKVIDTTGAGDSFMAGVLSQLPSSFDNVKNLEHAKQIIQFGAACGALVCSGTGAIEPQPTMVEVLNFISSLG